MPNIITHYLFAKAVQSEINDDTLKSAIANHPQLFVIGSNGPDFMFFYKFFKTEFAPFRKLGNNLHSSHINDFYRSVLRTYQQAGEQKSAVLAYMAGHLCHWALDCTTHPYVFYKTGCYNGINESMHHRFESMMDAMMLKEILNKDIRHFKFYELAKSSMFDKQIVAKVYVQAIYDCFKETITEQQVFDSLEDWFKLQKALYDPRGVKTRLLKVYEKKEKKPYLYSGNVIPTHINETFDVLNRQKKVWCYPVDELRVSNESFFELFERAKAVALSCFKQMYNEQALCEILADDTYDTGTHERKEMCHFDLIYEDLKNESN